MEVMLGPLVSIPTGEGRTFQIGETRIAVFHLRTGEVFATEAECPHRKGPLADGLLGGTTLVCPLHGRKFDLTTGASLDGNCAVKTYAARAHENGQIFVDLG